MQEYKFIVPVKNQANHYRISILPRPDARDQRIYEQDNILCVDLLNSAMKGKANAELLKLIGKTLGIAESEVYF